MANVRRSRKGSFFRGGRQVRETEWAFVAPTNTTIGAASTAVLIGVANAALLLRRPFTVIRMRGFWHVRSDQSAASEDWGCSLGWSLASDAAVAIGVTAVLTPIVDQASDGFFSYETLLGRVDVASAIGITEVGKSSQYDSRAMRKCEPDDMSPVLVIETPAITSSAVVAHQARMLIKLH